MNEPRTRKTDRRTLYTRRVIKDALLSLLSTKKYEEITVAELCRQAEINRGTFYLHYSNITQVADELFEEALNSMHSVFVQIGCETASEEKSSISLCRFLRENRKYQPLFFAESLHNTVIEKLASYGRESYFQYAKAKSGLTEQEIEAIYYFQLNGCLAISKMNASVSDEQWSRVQFCVDRFLKTGFSNL